MARYDLSKTEHELIRKRGRRVQFAQGAILFWLEKLAAVLSLANEAAYVVMRGQSIEDFQRSRNTQRPLHSVGKGVGY